MGGKSWDFTHDPEARPLGCNGRYGGSGVARHRYNGEEPCEACRASAAHYRREYRRGGIERRKPKPCGTVAAAERHRRLGEPLDFLCRLAWAEKARNDRAKARAASSLLPKMGPNSPFSPGNRTLLGRTCVDCGEFLPGDQFHLTKRNGSRRHACRRCANRRAR